MECLHMSCTQCPGGLARRGLIFCASLPGGTRLRDGPGRKTPVKSGSKGTCLQDGSRPGGLWTSGFWRGWISVRPVNGSLSGVIRESGAPARAARLQTGPSPPARGCLASRPRAPLIPCAGPPRPAAGSPDAARSLGSLGFSGAKHPKRLQTDTTRAGGVVERGVGQGGWSPSPPPSPPSPSRPRTPAAARCPWAGRFRAGSRRSRWRRPRARAG